MQTTIRRAGDVGVFHFAGDFDGGTECLKTTKQFTELMDQGVRKFVLDFAQVRWINSNGVGCLIAGKRMADAKGARMALCHLNRRSLSVLHTMRLEEVFPCVFDLEEALIAVSGAPSPDAAAPGAAAAPAAPAAEPDPRDQI